MRIEYIFTSKLVNNRQQLKFIEQYKNDCKQIKMNIYSFRSLCERLLAVNEIRNENNTHRVQCPPNNKQLFKII